MTLPLGWCLATHKELFSDLSKGQRVVVSMGEIGQYGYVTNVNVRKAATCRYLRARQKGAPWHGARYPHEAGQVVSVPAFALQFEQATLYQVAQVSTRPYVFRADISSSNRAKSLAVFLVDW